VTDLSGTNRVVQVSGNLVIDGVGAPECNGFADLQVFGGTLRVASSPFTSLSCFQALWVIGNPVASKRGEISTLSRFGVDKIVSKRAAGTSA
jgi:hypothetical protein